jgi:DNA polymerase III sliding clamp (beta) subunit (PCNA family)
MTLTKKQVKSLLEVISSDDTRPMLQQVKIDTFEDKPVLVATDGYVLAAINLDDSVLPEVGKMIDRSEIVKWYKLATNKDIFSEATLLELPKTHIEGVYPVWQKLVPEAKDFSAQASMRFNAQYMATIQTLAARDGYNAGLCWELYGKLSPLVARDESGTYLVMPLKG